VKVRIGLAVIILLVMLAATSQAACIQSIPTSYKSGIMKGVFSLATNAQCTAQYVPWPCCTNPGTGTCTADTFKIALYDSSGSNLGPSTTAYTAAGEETGVGYTAGGIDLTGCTIGTSGTSTYFDCDDASWPDSTITANCFMIYDASKANAAMYIGTFTQASSVNGTFTVVFPSAIPWLITLEDPS
jgi:hypothetical protein